MLHKIMNCGIPVFVHFDGLFRWKFLEDETPENSARCVPQRAAALKE